MRAVVGLALVFGGITFGTLVLTGHIPPSSTSSSSTGNSGGGSSGGGSDPGAQRK